MMKSRYSRANQDQFNREAFEKLSNSIICLEERLYKSGGRVCLPCLDLNGGKTSFLHNMSIRDALQHLINCLGITYSPDKFNHE